MKRSLDINSLRNDICSNLTDEEIAAKYNISEDALQRIYRELIQAIAKGKATIQITE